MKPRSLTHVARAMLFAALVGFPALAAAAALDSPARHSGYTYGSHHRGGGTRDFEYAILNPRESSMTSSTERDMEALRDLLGHETRDVFWFSLDKADYVVRDANLVDKAKQAVAPMQELGERQGELGARQSVLGERQGELGARQGRLGSRMGELSARLRSTLNAASGGDPDGDAGVAQARREIETLRAQQEALRLQQQPLADQQRELGARQRDLGRRQQAASAAASEALEKLAREAIRMGKAQPMQP